MVVISKILIQYYILREIHMSKTMKYIYMISLIDAHMLKLQIHINIYSMLTYCDTLVIII